MTKLTWLKRFVIFYGLMIIIVTVDKWFFGWILQFSPERQALTFSYTIFKEMGFIQRSLGLMNEGALTFVFLTVLFYLYVALKNIQKQQTFSEKTINSLGKMAKNYLFYTIMFPITMALQSVITTFHNPPGQRYLNINLSGINFDQILMAWCLYVILHVMREAYHVSSEHKMVI